MKVMWLLCLCFVSFNALAYADDETSTSNTSSSVSEAISTHSDDLTTLEINQATTSNNEPVTNSTASSVPTESTTSITDTSTAKPIETSEPANSNVSSTKLNGTAVILKLSNQIGMILEHLQDSNPVGFPGQNILPDPLPGPNISQGLGIIGHSEFYNVTVYGLSNFTVVSINIFLAQLKVYVKIRIKDVLILGNHSETSAFFFTTQGQFRLTMENVTAEGVVFLVVEPDGSLHANRSITTMRYEKVKFHLGDRSEAPLSTVLDAAGLTIIQAVLPYIQARIDNRLTNEVNKQLENSPKFPGLRDISPIDLAIMKGRQYVSNKYDPYVIKNIIDYDSNHLAGKVGPITLHGLSNFARVGDVSFGVENKTMVIKMRMITGKLRGNFQFYFNFGKVKGLPGREGKANISIEHLQFEAVVHQSMNTKQKPQLQDLKLETGPIKVGLDRQGSFDFLIEMAIRHLPDYLRNYMIEILEEPIKRKIQSDILNEVNVEEVVSNNLSRFEELLQKHTQT